MIKITIKIEYADRVGRLPPYIFAKIEEILARKRKEGVDLIPLGIGDPDLPTLPAIVEELKKQVDDPRNHQYPSSAGESFFREGIARWMKGRFGVDLDADKGITNVIGGKEGVANIARAFVNPGDVVLCPEPGYPVYANGATKLCDGEPFIMPLKKENGFLPDLGAIPDGVLKKAKMMYLNYPNNPTAAIAPEHFLKEAADLAEDHNIIIVYDNAYSEFFFDDYVTPSFLETSMDHVEIHSSSKTFNMTGYRCGWVAGNPEIIAGLRKIKSQIDSGSPMFIQRAVLKGLELYRGKKRPPEVEHNMGIYQDRRNVMIRGLKKLGWKVTAPKATFYIWVESPEGNSMDFAAKMINAGVVGTPGIGFGASGEGFLRFAMTQPVERIKEALERLATI
ncbi:MAG: aminotransferase class I/II-fold pyridoxal phosphate-dependent enzyme [Promethearchaeota archaeon]